jgi:uncharacterized protein
MKARAARFVLLALDIRAIRLLFVLILIAFAGAAYALTFPQLTGRVVDDAGILDPATKAALERKLADFEAKTTGQLVVVTLKALQGTSIEDYGYQLGRAWGIGQKEKNSGALLIVAPNERKVRIEVGYGLEGNVTDAVSKLIIENAILPRFRTGDFSGGITRGVANKRPDSQPGALDVLVFLLFLFVVFMIIRNVGRRGLPGPPQYRRGGPMIVPVPIPWGSGPSRSSGGFSGNGGFSGGGGSFGGGGASGDW